MNAWRFDWVTTWSEVWAPDHLEQWRSAFDPGVAAARTPFQHPAIVRAWVDAVGQERIRPFMMHARHPDGRRAFLPMVCEAHHARLLRPAGGTLFDYGAPVVLPSDGPARLDTAFWAGLEAELMSRAGDRFDAVFLGNLRLTGADAPAGAGWEQTDVAPFLQLDRHYDFEAWQATRGKRFRRSVRRSLRMAEQAGPLVFTARSPTDQAGALADVPRLMVLLRARHGDAFSDEPLQTFLKNLTGEPLAEGVVLWSHLSIGDRPACYEIGFRLDGVLYAYQGAFEPELSELSPGSLMHWRCIEWAFAEGITRYDLLRGDEAYKARWTDGEVARLVGRRLSRHRAAGPLRRALRGIRRRLRRIW